MTTENFVGTWKLRSLESQRSTGEVTTPFGKDIFGILMYDPAGHMSVQIMRTDRPNFASGERSKATQAEIEAAFHSMLTYYGTYDVDLEARLVTHEVESCSFPNWTGTTLQRNFEFFDNKLRLKTLPFQVGDATVISDLVWERVA